MRGIAASCNSFPACYRFFAVLPPARGEVDPARATIALSLEFPTDLPAGARHGKRAIVEADRKWTAAETIERVCAYFGCENFPPLAQQLN